MPTRRVTRASSASQKWIPLLEMPQGAGRWRQQQTVAARVISAFAPLAVHVAALRNGKGLVAAAADKAELAAQAAVGGVGPQAVAPLALAAVPVPGSLVAL